MLTLLAVHDSDNVHDIYAADSSDEMLETLKDSNWWEDIVNRLEEEGILEENITLNNIINLFHDGDSEVGYTMKQ